MALAERRADVRRARLYAPKSICNVYFFLLLTSSFWLSTPAICESFSSPISPTFATPSVFNYRYQLACDFMLQHFYKIRSITDYRWSEPIGRLYSYYVDIGSFVMIFRTFCFFEKLRGENFALSVKCYTAHSRTLNLKIRFISARLLSYTSDNGRSGVPTLNPPSLRHCAFIHIFVVRYSWQIVFIGIVKHICPRGNIDL